jgi:hypothetical protein
MTPKYWSGLQPTEGRAESCEKMKGPSYEVDLRKQEGSDSR